MDPSCAELIDAGSSPSRDAGDEHMAPLHAREDGLLPSLQSLRDAPSPRGEACADRHVDMKDRPEHTFLSLSQLRRIKQLFDVYGFMNAGAGRGTHLPMGDYAVDQDDRGRQADVSQWLPTDEARDWADMDDSEAGNGCGSPAPRVALRKHMLDKLFDRQPTGRFPLGMGWSQHEAQRASSMAKEEAEAPQNRARRTHTEKQANEEASPVEDGARAMPSRDEADMHRMRAEDQLIEEAIALMEAHGRSQDGYPGGPSGPAITSPSGVPFHYFAEHIVAPFFEAFFPLPGAGSGSQGATRHADGVDHFARGPVDQHPLAASVPLVNTVPSASGEPQDKDQENATPTASLDAPPDATPLDAVPPHAYRPRRASHEKAVLELFRVLDTTADGDVSWDEFSSFVLQSGQKRLLEQEQQAVESGATRACNGVSPPPAAVAKGRDESEVDVHTSTALRQKPTFSVTPTNRSVWQAQYPAVRFLYHHQPMTKLILSHRSYRYITGGPDGLVKLWRADPRLSDAQHRTAVVHERNILAAGAPIMDIVLSPPSLGGAEVVAVSAMDGTVTLLRTATGEVVRTLQGIRQRMEAGGSAFLDKLQQAHDLSGPGASVPSSENPSALSSEASPGDGLVLRVPYTVSAYHSEAMEMFFGKSNHYFQGLEVVAPTYAHLQRRVPTHCDVLYHFGADTVSKTTAVSLPRTMSSPFLQKTDPDAEVDDRGTDIAAGSARTLRSPHARAPVSSQGACETCWFARSLCLACFTPTGSQPPMPEGAYMLLGFDSGALQVYGLNHRWFSVMNRSATHVEPPSGRSPVHTFMWHRGAITSIIVSEETDLLITASDDGTVGIRHWTRLHVPLLTLGDGVLVEGVPRPLSGGSSGNGMVHAHTGHTKRITCCAWSEKHNLLVTAGMDFRVFLWSPRSSRPLNTFDLRVMQTAHLNLVTMGASGYPVDVSFMDRFRDPLRIIILDSRRILRLVDAYSGQLLDVLVDQSHASLALGDMHVARYEPHADRLILGGVCVRVWDILLDKAYAKDYTGHRKPILFASAAPSLQAFITADEDRVVVWRLRLVANEHAVQRRSRRRLAREDARQHNAKDAEQRKLIRTARRVAAATRAAGKGTRTSPDGSGSDGSRDHLSDGVSSTGGVIPYTVMIEGSDDEDAPDECVRAWSEDELEEIPEDPHLEELLESHPRDGVTPCNRTYWRSCTTVQRTWVVEAGIRAVALDQDVASKALYVVLLRENAIVQYNSFNGTPLKRLAFPAGARDMYGLAAGKVLLNASEQQLAPVLCAAFDAGATSSSGIAAVYHLRGDCEYESASAMAQPSSHPSDPHVSDMPVITARRELRLKDSAATSVVWMPSMGLIAIGAQGRILVSPIMDTTTHALPCTMLTDTPGQTTGGHKSRQIAPRAIPPAVVEEAECPSAQSSTRPTNGGEGCSVSSPTPRLSTTPIVPRSSEEGLPPVRRAPLDLMALFPGHLVKDPRILMPILRAPPRDTATSGPLSREDARYDAPVALPPADVAADQPSTLLPGALNNPSTSPTLGFLGHLCAVGETGYLLSTSSDGLLQLWNLKTWSEVLRLQVTLCAETLTAIGLSWSTVEDCNDDGRVALRVAVNSARLPGTSLRSTAYAEGSDCGARRREDPCYVALGDQSGYIVVLDLSSIPWHSATPLEKVEQLEDDVIVLDRWRAHRQDVRGLSFVSYPDVDVCASQEIGTYATAGCPSSLFCEDGGGPAASRKKPCWAPRGAPPGNPITLVSGGEDSYVFVWRWQQGFLNCLGCFGGGHCTPVNPPLHQHVARCTAVYETARRYYVMQRLVSEAYFFRRASTLQADLDMAVGLMEKDVTHLVEQDARWELGLWGNMEDGEVERTPKGEKAGRYTFYAKRNRLGESLELSSEDHNQPELVTRFLSTVDVATAPATVPSVLEQSGFESLQTRLQRHAIVYLGKEPHFVTAVRDDSEDETPSPATGSNLWDRLSTTKSALTSCATSQASSSFGPLLCDKPSPNAVYALAFMRGLRPEHTARDCLHRVVRQLHSQIRQHVKLASARQPKFRAAHSQQNGSTSGTVGPARRGSGTGMEPHLHHVLSPTSAAQEADGNVIPCAGPVSGSTRKVSHDEPIELQGDKCADTCRFSATQMGETNNAAIASEVSSARRGLPILTSVPQSVTLPPLGPSGRTSSAITMAHTAPVANTDEAERMSCLFHRASSEGEYKISGKSSPDSQRFFSDTLPPQRAQSILDAPAPVTAPRSVPTMANATSHSRASRKHRALIRLRGTEEIPEYHVPFGAAAALLRARQAEGHDGRISAAGGGPAGILAHEVLHTVSAADTEHGVEGHVEAAAPGRLTSMDGGSGGDVTDADDSPSSERESAATVVHKAYMARQREAAHQLIQLRHEERQRGLHKKHHRSKQLALDLGMVGMASYKDFSATGTNTVFFGPEKVLLKPVTHYRQPVGKMFMQGVVARGKKPNAVPRASSRELDSSSSESSDEEEEEYVHEADGALETWHLSRQQMKRRRKREEALWMPARVMTTLMGWNSPMPLRQPGSPVRRPEGAIGTPSTTQIRAGRYANGHGRTGGEVWTGSPSEPSVLPLPPIMRLLAPLPHGVGEDTKGPQQDSLSTISPRPGEHEMGAPAAQQPLTERRIATEDTIGSTHRGALVVSRVGSADNAVPSVEGSKVGPPINLNALIAEEVQILKDIMRSSLLEREAILAGPGPLDDTAGQDGPNERVRGSTGGGYQDSASCTTGIPKGSLPSSVHGPRSAGKAGTTALGRSSGIVRTLTLSERRPRRNRPDS